jgi:hypothetical protein
MAAPKTHPCPKCGRILQQSGEATVSCGDGTQLVVPVFQCDECLMNFDFGGESMEIALTFALDEKGQPFDPADPEGKLRF